VRDSLAAARYLQRHIEADLPAPPARTRWRHVLVIPAYRESPAFLSALSSALDGAGAGDGRVLVVLVLNRPDSDSDTGANNALRAALDMAQAPTAIVPRGKSVDLCVLDTETLWGPLPAARGVGLARKIGCDLAFAWITAGAIDSAWICCTDADAILPPDYFQRLQTAGADTCAAVFPFVHRDGPDAAINAATALYELRLHHHVLGLEYAGSPYAWHSLGSCLAVRASAYAHTRGFPKRSGAEDFYLLNKLTKLGPVARLGGTCVELAARSSNRAPFGTGPAVAAICAEPDPVNSALFYHPATYRALRAVLCAFEALSTAQVDRVDAAIAAHDVEPGLVRASAEALGAMNLDAALAHSRQQKHDPQRMMRHLNEWFDALRTLQFLHALRDAGWPQQTLPATQSLAPVLWPGSFAAPELSRLCASAALHWGWDETYRPGALVIHTV